MRAVRLREFGPPHVMQWEDVPAPDRRDGEVTVAVEAFGVNFADTMVRRGEYRRDQPLSFTPGFEVAGRVLEAPDGGGLSPGTRVAVFTNDGGGYAETIVAPRSQVCVVPDDVPSTVAASLLIQGVTGWYAVHRFGRVLAGEWVLVHGAAGGLGAMCVELVAAAGGRAIGAASSPKKRSIALRHGAEAAVDSNPDTLVAAVRELTGAGCDAVIDGIGGPLFAPSMRALAHSGRYLVVGSASQQPAMLDVRALMPRGQTVIGVLVARVTERDPAEPQGAFDEIVGLWRDGRLRPDVTVVGPDEIVAAHERIEARQHVGKVVVDLTGGSS